MKTTIEIADDLLVRARERARAEGTTLRALVEAGLRHVLDERAPADAGPFVPITWSLTEPGAEPIDWVEQINRDREDDLDRLDRG